MPRSQTAKPRKATHQSPLLRQILAKTQTPQFERYLRDLLVELCRIDTTPRADVAKMRVAEASCFQVIERELNSLSFPEAHLERRPINPAIQSHPNYSRLHFTKTSARPQGLPPEVVYANRSNLVYWLPGAGKSPAGQSLALNAHLDVVAPYFPPRFKKGIVYGRGACDDKASVASIVAALKVLSEVMPAAGLQWNREVLAMFVVEEETGGNGSLSLALDRDLRRHYDSILVGECTSLRVHPANRGAVWYQAELCAPPGTSNLKMFAFVNEEMEKEGAAIRAESRHPLFPQRPVQTCHGILGPFGEHPSRICGQVSFLIRFARQPDQRAQSLVLDCLESSVAGYVGLYGDKTRVTDPATGKPMVARHYDVQPEPNQITITVYGAGGHMGAVRERDGAITKMAHLLRSLLASKAKLEMLAGPVRFELPGVDAKDGSRLLVEGGQGFVSTHSLKEVMERLRQAAQRGVQNYLAQVGQAGQGQNAVTVTFDKLHNLAFDGDPGSSTMQNALAAAKACGLGAQEPVLGWTVSCDARLFASEYPGLPVLTFGPGQLTHAHSDQEQCSLREMRSAVEFLALFLLRQTGTCETL